MAGLKEAFAYDGLQRVAEAKRYATLAATTPAETQAYSYDATGNLLGKGSQYTGYSYTASTGCTNPHAQPHAVRQVTAGGSLRSYCYDANGNLTTISGANAGYTTVSWWAANLARRMSKGSTSAEFWYGPDRARVLQVATRSTESERTVYLGSLYERTVITPNTGSATTRHVHYVRAGDETLAIKTWSKVGAGTYNPQVRYLHRDHLGSVVAITTETGSVESRSSFDAWGKRRDPATWVTPAAGTFTAAPTATDRGYTGHEHVDELGLVHMNGRIYDPEIGKFLSADPTLQFPESTQGYNRYAYAGNNPLSYTDPSGFSFWKSLMRVVGWIGFIVSLVMPITTIWWQSILQSAWQGFLMSGGNLKAGLLAGLSAGLGMGLGKISFIARAGLLGKLAAGGLVSSAMGGSFGKGVVGSLVGMVRNSAISGMLETSGIAESIRDALDAGTTDSPAAVADSASSKNKNGSHGGEAATDQTIANAKTLAQTNLEATAGDALSTGFKDIDSAAVAAGYALSPVAAKYNIELSVNFYQRDGGIFIGSVIAGTTLCEKTSCIGPEVDPSIGPGKFIGNLHTHPLRDVFSIDDLAAISINQNRGYHGIWYISAPHGIFSLSSIDLASRRASYKYSVNSNSLWRDVNRFEKKVVRNFP